MAWIVGQAPVDIQNFHRPLCLPGNALLCGTHDSHARSAHGTRPAKARPVSQCSCAHATLQTTQLDARLQPS